MKNFNVTIIENGEFLQVDVIIAERLCKDDFIYLCSDCGNHVYHINYDKTFEEVEQQIKTYK